MDNSRRPGFDVIPIRLAYCWVWWSIVQGLIRLIPQITFLRYIEINKLNKNLSFYPLPELNAFGHACQWDVKKRIDTEIIP